MRKFLLTLLTLAACGGSEEPPYTPPPPTYAFADVYVCTLGGTQTQTQLDGTVDVLAAPANTYVVNARYGLISIPTAAFTGTVLDSGGYSGTYTLVYDPMLPEGALFELNHTGSASLYFWSIDTAGTLIENDLTGTCAASTP